MAEELRQLTLSESEEMGGGFLTTENSGGKAPKFLLEASKAWGVLMVQYSLFDWLSEQKNQNRAIRSVAAQQPNVRVRTDEEIAEDREDRNQNYR